jgi:hypothetical protein
MPANTLLAGMTPHEQFPDLMRPCCPPTDSAIKCAQYFQPERPNLNKIASIDLHFGSKKFLRIDKKLILTFL